jgi:hypothetical protein
MKKVRIPSLTAVVIFLLSIFQMPALAQPQEYDGLKLVPGTVLRGGRIRTGNLRLLAGLTLAGIYNDNIYYASGDIGDPVEEDYITAVRPTAYLDWTFPERGGLRIGYEGDYAFYEDFDFNDWKRHQGRFDFDYLAPGGLIARINDVYIDTGDPFGNANEFALGAPQTQRWSNDFSSRFGFAFSHRLRVLVFGDYFRQEYDNIINFTQDWDDYRAGAGIETGVMPKTWLYLRYYYGGREYTTQAAGVTTANNADYTYHQGNIGLEWDPGSKIRGQVDVGYQWRSYKNEIDSYGIPYSDKNTWIARTSINYLPRGRTEYEVQETSLLSFNFWRGINSVGADTAEFYTETGTSGVVRYDINPKINLRWFVEYSHKDYRNAVNEQAGRGSWGLDFTWRIQSWLGVSVGYVWEKQNSTVETNDFEINRASLR